MDDFVREGIDETATLTLDYGDTTGVINSSWQVPAFGKTRTSSSSAPTARRGLDYLENTELEIFDAEVYSDRDSPLTSRNDGSIVHTTEKREPLKAEIGRSSTRAWKAGPARQRPHRRPDGRTARTRRGVRRGGRVVHPTDVGREEQPAGRSAVAASEKHGLVVPNL